MFVMASRSSSQSIKPIRLATTASMGSVNTVVPPLAGPLAGPSAGLIDDSPVVLAVLKSSTVGPQDSPQAGSIERELAVSSIVAPAVAPASDIEPDTLSDAFLEKLGVAVEQRAQILQVAGGNSSSQSGLRSSSRTPDGMTGCRQGIMAIMGFLKKEQRIAGQLDFLQAVYALGGGQIDKGPMGCASKLLSIIKDNSDVYALWQDISKQRSERHFKRGEDKPFFLEKIPHFIASFVILLSSSRSSSQSSELPDLKLDGQSLSTLSSLGLPGLITRFTAYFSGSAITSTTISGSAGFPCVALTQKKHPCQKSGKNLHTDGNHYCTQHLRLITSSA